MRCSYVKFLLLAIYAQACPLAVADSDDSDDSDDATITTITFSPGDIDFPATTFSFAEEEPGLSKYNPDLQKLRDFRSVLRSDDKYFHTVGWVYRNSGFRALGNALEFSRSIMHRLADPTSRVIPRKQAVRTIRRLQVALRDTPRYMPKFSKSHSYEPETSGYVVASIDSSPVTYPNYTGLAFRYLTNLQTALSDKIRGHRLTQHVLAPKKELWIRVNQFDGSFSANGALFQNATAYTATGAYSYSPSYSSATLTTVAYSTASGAINITAVGPMPLTLSGSDFRKTGTVGRHWIAFLSGAPAPTELINYDPITLGVPYTVNGVALATGTRLFQVADNFAVPASAIPLDGTDLSAVPTPH